MANWTNENGDKFSGRTWSAGNAITAARWVYAQVLRLFRDGKSFAVPGEISTACEMEASSGGRFWVAVTCADGGTVKLITAANYRGITPDGFTDDGLRNRYVHVQLWVEVAIAEATAESYLPGGGSEDTIMGADGSSPDLRFGQWLKSGQGAGTNYDILYTAFGGGETLNIYLDGDDLTAAYGNGGGANDYCAIVGWVDISPPITAA